MPHPGRFLDHGSNGYDVVELPIGDGTSTIICVPCRCSVPAPPARPKPTQPKTRASKPTAPKPRTGVTPKKPTATETPKKVREPKPEKKPTAQQPGRKRPEGRATRTATPAPSKVSRPARKVRTRKPGVSVGQAVDSVGRGALTAGAALLVLLVVGVVAPVVTGAVGWLSVWVPYLLVVTPLAAIAVGLLVVGWSVRDEIADTACNAGRAAAAGGERVAALIRAQRARAADLDARRATLHAQVEADRAPIALGPVTAAGELPDSDPADEWTAEELAWLERVDRGMTRRRLDGYQPEPVEIPAQRDRRRST